MNNAIIYLKDEFEASLGTVEYLGSSLVENLIEKLKDTSVSKVYVVGSEREIAGAEKKNSLEEIFEEIYGTSGKTLLISPFYPLLKSYYFEAMLKDQHEGIALCANGEFLKVYAFLNNKAEECFDLNYHSYNIEEIYAAEIKDIEELRKLEKSERNRINTRLLKSGVNIHDVDNTYISESARIEKGVSIEPNVFITGKTTIRKNAAITSGSVINDSEIGEGTIVENSRIDTCIIHRNVTIGPMAHLRMKSEVFDGARVGNFVEFKNVRFGKGSKCAHLTYLGDCVVGERVNIGCGVVTVNYDGMHKFATIIKDDAFIGSNANLIAPVTIGSYAVVAAGSTITDDVKDHAMAIARGRQMNKEGYGYSYIKKEK